jgi:hypothetical protein
VPELDPDDIAGRLARLGGIPPQHATPETVAEAQDIALRIADPGTPWWFEAQMLLGNHLLETPGGVRAENVAAAEAAYRRILERAAAGTHERNAGEFGLANALLRRPESGEAEFLEAARLYEHLMERAAGAGDVDSLIKYLGNATHLYGSSSHGDVDANVEKAIGLQERVFRPPLLAGLTRATKARAEYNLASLFLRRRAGVRSQNIDRAVHLLLSSLEGRPEQEDPVGRVRTLRALAMAFPDWGGADSLEHARSLAENAVEEASRIEQRSAVMQHRTQGWANIARQQSALNAELPDLVAMSREEAVSWLNSRIRNHLEVVAQIPWENEPSLWASWHAGLGRLLAQLPRLDIRDKIGLAFDCFTQALAAVDCDEHTRLYCDICCRLGELAHEVGDFEKSWRAYSAAAVARDVLIGKISDFDHRMAELTARRGYGLYAAFAAARLENVDEAIQLAESERTRVLDELIEGVQTASELPAAERGEVVALIERIREVQARLFELKSRTPEGYTAMLQGALADAVGAPRELLQMSQIRMPDGMSVATTSEIQDANEVLNAARLELRQLNAGRVNSFQAENLHALSQSTGAAIGYVLVTTWGLAAVGSLPDGNPFIWSLDELTTTHTVRLVHGAEGQPSFADAVSSEDPAVLAGYLDTVTEVVGKSFLLPFGSWLREQGVTHAVLIPAGSFSAMPLQIIESPDVTFSFAPSARLLALSRAGMRTSLEGPAMILASPSREDEHALPWSLVECRFLQMLREGQDIRALSGAGATRDALRDAAAGASYVHIASHAQFRPADPLASRLLLAGDDSLTLQDAMRGLVDFSSARLINLAACQTGNAEFVRAPDEQLGFGAIFLSLGVPAVVSTRWNVDDATAAVFSARLMELMYEEKLEPAPAVAAARRWLRSANAGQLKQLVSRMQSSLRPEDHDARVALASLRSELAMSAPDELTRFSSVVHWGAFTLTGL